MPFQSLNSAIKYPDSVYNSNFKGDIFIVDRGVIILLNLKANEVDVD